MSAETQSVTADQDTTLTDYFVNNPRMIGVLFTILLLISQAGNAAGAPAATTIAGP